MAEGFGARPPEKQRTKDGDLGRALWFGCGVVFLMFLVGWALIAVFWLNS
jgi:zona occludens toxin (predicted ATPase)